MNQIPINRLVLTILTFASFCFSACSRPGVSATYVSEENPKEYIELKSNGSFLAQTGSRGPLEGQYEMEGKTITFSIGGGMTRRGTMDGPTMTDPEGKHWTKK
ncbi:MAG: hypothetical protein ACR2MF_08870 [Chthoniobacterales bacterium]